MPLACLSLNIFGCAVFFGKAAKRKTVGLPKTLYRVKRLAFLQFTSLYRLVLSKLLKALVPFKVYSASLP